MKLELKLFILVTRTLTISHHHQPEDYCYDDNSNYDNITILDNIWINHLQFL